VAYATCYDAQGRVVSTSDPLIAGEDASQITHDAFDRVTAISGPSALAMTWSVSGQAVKVDEVASDGASLVATTLDTYGSQILDKTVGDGDSSSTIRYAGPFRLTVVDGAAKGIESVQYPLPGGARVTTAPGAGATLTVAGIDGSALVSIDIPALATGANAAPEPAGLALVFGPYGEPLGATPAPSTLPSYGWKSAAGQETLAGASGVTIIGARPYHPALGQFLSPDPDPEAASNAYAYTSGDPINSSDPDGFEQQDGLMNVFLPIMTGVVIVLGILGGGLGPVVGSGTLSLVAGGISTVAGAVTGFFAAQGLTDDIRVQIGAAILGAGVSAGLSWGSYRLARGPGVASQKKAYWKKLDETRGMAPIENDLQFEVWQKWDLRNPGVVPISNEPIVRANRASLNPFSGPTQGPGGIPNQKWQGHEWHPQAGYMDGNVPLEIAFKQAAAAEGLWNPY
jgi:RHS repeat-associated protein